MSTSENSGKRVFITGASGFIGYHIAHHLLNEGYNVRAAARGVKVERLRQALSTVHDTSRFEVVDVPDIASGDFSEILKDVDAVIHLAFPVTGRPGFELALRVCICAHRPLSGRCEVQGSLHVLKEGVKAGVHKFVTTSSTGTFNSVENGWGIHDYTTTTEKEARTGGVVEIYRYVKALCDRKVLEFQDEHPEIDVTILAPDWVYGPFPSGFEHIVPEPDIPSISTNLFIYSLLAKNTAHCLPVFPGYADARDVARIHELALKSRPTSEVGHKRFVVISPHDSSWADAASHLAKERPGLKDRLLEAVDIPKSPFGNSVVGINPDGLEKAVGFKPSDYIKWEDTILETADSMLALEAGWKAKGFSVAVPTQATV